MDKKRILCLFLFLGSIFIGGCETAKGAAYGAAYGISATAAGVGKDTYNAYNFIQAMDRWIRKNLW